MMSTDNDSRADRTLRLWQARTSRKLTPEDVREITTNMTGFFQLLLEWQAGERRADTVQAKAGSPCLDEGRPG
jgi:hypothetical protein